MSWPHPRPGMVIRYAYLWKREHEAGLEEGKDRPAAVIIVLGDEPGRDMNRMEIEPIRTNSDYRHTLREIDMGYGKSNGRVEQSPSPLVLQNLEML